MKSERNSDACLKGAVTAQFLLITVICWGGWSGAITSPNILRKARTLGVYVKYSDCCIPAQLKNKTRVGQPSGQQTSPYVNLHPMLYTLNSTCHKPGRQLLIPESQSYLWFPLVTLIKGNRKKIHQSQVSNGISVFKKQRRHLTAKGLYSQSYGFSSSHVWM